jgi:hypothetical protein
MQGLRKDYARITQRLRNDYAMDQEVYIRHILRSNYAELCNDYANITQCYHCYACYAVLCSVTQHYAHGKLLKRKHSFVDSLTGTCNGRPRPVKGGQSV